MNMGLQRMWSWVLSQGQMNAQTCADDQGTVAEAHQDVHGRCTKFVDEDAARSAH